MTAIQTYYASVGRDTPIETLEIRRPSIADSIFIARAYQNYNLRTEDGREVIAQGVQVNISYPEQSEGLAQTIKFAIDNVRLQATDYFRDALEQDEEAQLIFRRYLKSDLNYPCERPNYYIIRGISIKETVVTLSAGHFDVVNYRYPRGTIDSNTIPDMRFQQ